MACRSKPLFPKTFVMVFTISYSLSHQNKGGFLVLIRENLDPMCPVLFHLNYKSPNFLRFSKGVKCSSWWLWLTAQGLGTLPPSHQGSWWPGAGDPPTELQPGTQCDSKASASSIPTIPEQEEQSSFGRGNQDQPKVQ